MRRERKGGVSTDLLACLPSPGQLSMRPKTICSTSSSFQRRQQRLSSNYSRGSSLFRTSDSAEATTVEPTSPKVTCSGQIKVSRAKPISANCGKSWQTLVAEMEKAKRRPWPQWTEALFLFNVFRGFSSRLACFGSLTCASTREEEEEDEDNDDDDDDDNDGSNDDDSDYGLKTFSKWFIVSEESMNRDIFDKRSLDLEIEDDDGDDEDDVVDDDDDLDDDVRDCGSAASPLAAPPPNALLLMRALSLSSIRRRDEAGNATR